MSSKSREEKEADDDPSPLRTHDGVYLARRLARSEEASSSGSQHSHRLGVTLVRDAPNWLSLIRNLHSSDIILLLTPLVTPTNPDPGDTSDPLETLGRALALRHSKIRHQPYTNRNGITSTHVGFIKRATVVFFVINDAVISGATPQFEAARVTEVVAAGKPVIVILTNDSHELLRLAEDFPTVIQSRDYSLSNLESAASLIFGDSDASASPGSSLSENQSLQPRSWLVELWDETMDVSTVTELWNLTLSPHFTIRGSSLASILNRPGYARHYFVKHPTRLLLLGFCATFLTYVDQEGEKLMASLAILLVRPEYQRQGIGLSLHNHALDQLKQTRGVGRLQLGSTFPRLLYGPPYSMDLNHTWYSKRGWQTNSLYPGRGMPVYDLILDFVNWHRFDQPLPNGLFFRPCTQPDMQHVLELVEEETTRGNNIGWFDQYSRLINDVHVKDIVLAIETETIVAVALTYTPASGSPVASDLPWARQVNSDIGGVTCICITYPRRDALMVPLLDACVKMLQNQGMRRMFLDGITSQADEYIKLVPTGPASSHQIHVAALGNHEAELMIETRVLRVGQVPRHLDRHMRKPDVWQIYGTPHK